MIDGKQALEPSRLKESLFRTPNPSGVGVAVPWDDTPSVQNTYRYHNYFWAKHMTTAEFPQYRCDFWVPFMSGSASDERLEYLHILQFALAASKTLRGRRQAPMRCVGITSPSKAFRRREANLATRLRGTNRPSSS
jgi:hypothetical protein